MNGSVFVLVLGWRSQRQLGDRIRLQRFGAHPTQKSALHLPKRSWRDDGGCVCRFPLCLAFLNTIFVPLKLKNGTSGCHINLLYKLLWKGFSKLRSFAGASFVFEIRLESECFLGHLPSGPRRTGLLRGSFPSVS